MATNLDVHEKRKKKFERKKLQFQFWEMSLNEDFQTSFEKVQ
jgi:hypothetical protein